MKVFEAPVHKEENSKSLSQDRINSEERKGIKLLLLPGKLSLSNNPHGGFYELEARDCSPSGTTLPVNKRPYGSAFLS